jgi:hypothetical protein
MLGISFLTEILDKNFEYYNPAKILNILRKRVINSLNQEGKIGEARDGFDMSLCIINESKQELMFTGANTKIKILRNNKYDFPDNAKIIEGNEYSILEFKGNRIPIGIPRKEKDNFTNTRIKINEGDSLYLMTDGYVDQFGGINGEKFKSNKLNKLLIDIQKNNMREQYTRLVEEFTNWRKLNNYEQTDDVLVIGIKF